MFWFRRSPDSDGVGVAVTSDEADFSDPPSSRLRVFDRLVDELGVKVAVVRQVHGASVLDVDDVPEMDGSLLDLTFSESDAMVSTRRGIALAVRVADCVPVLLADARASVIGAAHAGRAGLLEGVISATVEAMRVKGAREISAWVGPHLCGRCYELPSQVVNESSNRLGVAPTTTSWGTSSLDLTAAVTVQLDSLGVPSHLMDGCTRTDPNLHSWRRDGEAAGRQVGLVWLV